MLQKQRTISVGEGVKIIPLSLSLIWGQYEMFFQVASLLQRKLKEKIHKEQLRQFMAVFSNTLAALATMSLKSYLSAFTFQLHHFSNMKKEGPTASVTVCPTYLPRPYLLESREEGGGHIKYHLEPKINRWLI